MGNPPQHRLAAFFAIVLCTAAAIVGLPFLMTSYGATLGAASPTSSGQTAHQASSGSQPDALAIFRDGSFYLLKTLSAETASITISLGNAKSLPLAGDWTGNGLDTVGVYDPATAHFVLLQQNHTGSPAMRSFSFGPRGGLPIAGAWTGKGTDSIGVYSAGKFYLRNTLTPGKANEVITLGRKGDIPIAGNWTGQAHHIGVGVYRPSTGTFYLTDRICTCKAAINHTVVLGPPNSLPFTGDWVGKGYTGLGVFHAATRQVYLKNDATHPSRPNLTFQDFGSSRDRIVAGRWVSVNAARALSLVTPSERWVRPSRLRAHIA